MLTQQNTEILLSPKTIKPESESDKAVKLSLTTASTKNFHRRRFTQIQHIQVRLKHPIIKIIIQGHVIPTKQVTLNIFQVFAA